MNSKSRSQTQTSIIGESRFGFRHKADTDKVQGHPDYYPVFCMRLRSEQENKLTPALCATIHFEAFDTGQQVRREKQSFALVNIPFDKETDRRLNIL